MELNPRQLSSLNEMGIPVWEFRSSEAEEVVVVVEDNLEVYPSEQLLNCDWVVMIDNQNYGEQAQRLLHAMLLSVGVKEHQLAIIDTKQLSQLQTIAAQKKVLIILGSSMAQELLDENIVRGSIHQTMDSKISTVVSYALDDLLENPQKKAHAWQDLQLAKQALL